MIGCFGVCFGMEEDFVYFVGGKYIVVFIYYFDFVGFCWFVNGIFVFELFVVGDDG